MKKSNIQLTTGRDSATSPNSALDRDEDLADEILAAHRNITDRKVGAEVTRLTPAEQLRALEHLPADVQMELRWLRSYLADNSLTNSDASKLINVHASHLPRLLRGDYAGNWQTMAKRIRQARELIEKRAAVAEHRFAETSVSRRIFEAINYAYARQSIVFVIGPSYCGKDEAAKEWIRRDQFKATRMIYMPTLGGAHIVVKRTARAVGVAGSSSDELQEGIFESLDHRNLFIINEAHKALLGGQESVQVNKLHFFREIWDKTGCPMVFLATELLADSLERGRLRPLMRELANRGRIIRLQTRQPVSDFLAIAKVHGLGAPTQEALERITVIRNEQSLGSFADYIKDAVTLAKKRKQAVSWAHFTDAYNMFVSYAKKQQQEDEA
jgi:DNA transposition AAA+ family ATPase